MMGEFLILWKIMLPIIFKEQFNNPAYTITERPSLSLRDYKIDYNDFLGAGVYGNVYGLVKRPENEKTFFSEWFPWLSDLLFRANSSDKQNTEWCIKISKSIPRLIAQEIIKENDCFLAPAIYSLYEKREQLQANNLLQQYRMTNIVYSETSNYYSQIKTRVKGKTLTYCGQHNYFQDPDQFLFRKAYVDFLWKINNVPLVFSDLHSDNLMYDEISHEIEIVDSSAKETIVNEGNHITNLFRYSDTATYRTVKELQQVAKNNTPYTKKFDNDLITRMRIKTKPKQTPHEFHSTKDNNYADISKYVVDNYLIKKWRKGVYPPNFFEKEITPKKVTQEESLDKIIHKAIG